MERKKEEDEGREKISLGKQQLDNNQYAQTPIPTLSEITQNSLTFYLQVYINYNLIHNQWILIIHFKPFLSSFTCTVYTI